MNEEVFGPVLSIRRVGSWQEAIDVENSNPYGNAAAIYTTNGGHAEWFIRRFRTSVSRNHHFPFRRFCSPLERVASLSLSIRTSIFRACECVRLDAPPKMWGSTSAYPFHENRSVSAERWYRFSIPRSHQKRRAMFSSPRTLLSHRNRFDCFTLLFVCHRTPGGFGGLYGKKSKYGDMTSPATAR
jgi:hypothetical protein